MDTPVVARTEGLSASLAKRSMPTANRNATLILGLALLALVLFLGILMTRLQLKLNRMDREAREAALANGPPRCVFCGTQLVPHRRSSRGDRCVACLARHGEVDKPADVDVEKQNAQQLIYEVRD